MKKMFNTPYGLYMMEAEGIDNMVNTKEARINASIKDFVSLAQRGYDINDIQEMVFDKHNLNLNDLSARDKAKIKREVERRFH
jgi:hypothetical protein